ncbi:MAG: DHA2 family efflux MFS transporter permease subunit [Actinomycetota bacterium]|nr:DHA2 family efflux MFS transporter permease subunit [Actinomycetota bacterium]
MSIDTAEPDAVPAPDGAHLADPQRWRALVVIAIAQLMIVVDASIVNVALPSAQHALHISVANRQWVITAYTLAFGGLLLLGGRVADYLGRKPVFLIGLGGFALASAIGGLAPNAGVLFGARALQGAFAAVMAPAALSLLAVTFTDAKERARAFGVYGGIAGGGAAIGLILGGVLTQYASWRWCLLVNVPIAILTAIAAQRVVKNSRASGQAHYDLVGAATVTVGLVALVFGVTKASTDGWSALVTLVLLGVAALLLVGFVVLETRVANPLLPMRVLTERNRAGAFLASTLSASAMFGMFLFLTYYLQGVLHYSPLTTGFAFLPFSVGIIISATGASSLMTRLSPRLLMTTGLVMAGIGFGWFTQIGVHSSFATHILPGEIVMSLGLGLVFVPVSSVALFRVSDNDAGVASAMVNTTQQVGGAVGTAVLNTVAATATAAYLRTHGVGSSLAGAVHGYTVAFVVGAVVVGVAIIAVIALIRTRAQDVAAAPGDLVPVP